MIGLDGKVVWITGASRGIGKATAEAFAASGANLALNATDAEALSLVADTLKARFGIQCLVLPYDVSREEAVKAAAREIQSAFGRLDVLVNNAGLMRDAAIGMLRSEDMVRTMEVNVQGPLNHMQLASRLMMRKKEGAIINVSSIIGRFGNAGQALYAASKSALIGATYSAAKELAPYGIRVNAVAPGFIETELVQGFTEQKREQTLRSIPMGRQGTPEEVADVALFLASSLARYVTGQVVGVDGGMVV